MNLTEAKTLAIKLMYKHNLIQQGWGFGFDNAKRRFGVCNYRKKMISLSKSLVELNDEKRVTNTILHEIAHAMLGPGYGHGAIWKQVAKDIGCDGERCYKSSEVLKPKSKYQAVCKTCGTTHNRHRLPLKSYSCGICSRTFNKNYLLIYEKVW
jgi:predicted SprT family Zn-dependent metalloprotease